MSDGKFYRLRKMFDLQAEINELDATSRLLRKIESKHSAKKGNKRLVSKLGKARETIENLKGSLEQDFHQEFNKSANKTNNE